MGSIDKVDFWQACIDLHSRARRLNLNFEIFEEDLKFLRTTKILGFKDLNISHGDQVVEEPVDASDEIEDNVIYSVPTIQSGIRVEYDISYSPSYRVPVLHFRVMHDELVKNKLDFIYDHLVPQSRSHELQSVGILGAISQTNHPTLGIPCFFIHPCKTSEAIEALTAGRQVSAIEYLQIWIGLIGSAVGLDLPIELAMNCK